MTDASAAAPHADALETRLLLVEDDEDDAILVCDLLEAWPEVGVTSTPTLAEAERRLVEEHFDCVLLDLGLPDARRFEALERVAGADLAVAVVVLTGDSDEQRGVAALGAGAQDYLVKGRIDAGTLRRAIRYAVERKAGERARQELAMAHAYEAENARLQRGLLPASIVTDPRIGVTAAYRPGSGRSLLGGDFYDVVEDAEGTVRVMVGDVCGHGPDEAALGVRLRMAWRTLVLAGVAQDALLPILDRVLMHEQERPGVFASVADVAIEPGRCRATVRLAGHPPPIAFTTESIRLLDACPTGPLLGIDVGGEWPAAEVELGGAWSLMLYTDGIYEGFAAGRGGERLGLDGLMTFLESVAGQLHQDDSRALDALISEVERCNGGQLLDDVAILAVSCGERPDC